MKRMHGFTLLEVLVALAIFATVAASVLSASQRSLAIAEQLELKAMAGWIADNRVTELQLQTPTPGEGREDKVLEFGGRDWEIHSEIDSTSDKDLRRVTVWVAPKLLRGGGVPVKERAVKMLTGFLAVRG
ncbi:type II secretion system minor pseudopilin GspI [Pseudomonas sp. J452]|uniref:type II secretion system minor pseudopilin GspI n=1 Tax=Pseudomonas sp. J452 TaxID=2898441 RepID=UPI0021ADB64A|nr:type II secretion system minor pseudopilin GspI [Pseudomonas sp. J452]UUY07333.1 type II secretion system minor pseudopilin GspI [Pseudomonas sp. J452]